MHFSSSGFSLLSSFLLSLFLLFLLVRTGDARGVREEGGEEEEVEEGGNFIHSSFSSTLSYSSPFNSSSPLSSSSPSSTLNNDDERVMLCYHGSWAVYRPGRGKFVVEDIDPYLCTHLVYAFAGLHSDTHTIVSLDPYNDLYDNYGKGGYKRFTGLKKVNPDLKTLLAIGGWNEGSRKYSEMVSSAGSRSTFISSCVEFLHKYDFDGLDLDWEYPTLRGGRPQDKANFGLLLKEMRGEFDQHGLLITSAVSAGKLTIDVAYDIQAMASYLDLVNLMAYDLHGSWETFAHHHEPLYAYSKDTGPSARLNVDYAVRYWLHLGLPANKLLMGVGCYGRCYTLSSSASHAPYAPAPQPGTAGPYTRARGILGYNEICEAQGGGGWSVVRDKNMVSPYTYKGRQWCGYDDPTSAAVKAKYIKAHGLAGAMVWSLDIDDFTGYCSNQVEEEENEEEEEGGGGGEEEDKERFPIITTIRIILRDGKPIPTPTPAPIPTPTTTTTDIPTTTPITTTTTPAPTPAPSRTCHREGFNADPNGDCTVFYECQQEGGKWRVWKFHCPLGTVFVEDLQGCDFPDFHPACPLMSTLPPLPPTTTTPPTTLPPTTTAPPTTSTLPPRTDPPAPTLPPTTLAPLTLPPTSLPPATLPPTTPDDLPDNTISYHNNVRPYETYFASSSSPSSVSSSAFNHSSSSSSSSPSSSVSSSSSNQSSSSSSSVSSSSNQSSSSFASPRFSPFPESSFPYSSSHPSFSSSSHPIKRMWDPERKAKWRTTYKRLKEQGMWGRGREESNAI